MVMPSGWMASPTRWTWVWVNSGSWWWTGRPGVLWFMGSQRVGHDWATELNWMLSPDKSIFKLCSADVYSWKQHGTVHFGEEYQHLGVTSIYVKTNWFQITKEVTDRYPKSMPMLKPPIELRKPGCISVLDWSHFLQHSQILNHPIYSSTLKRP